MNIHAFVLKYNLRERIETAISRQQAASLLFERVADVPVRRSHAVRRLGSYIARGGEPVAIRLQFAQEENLLIETFLHELAHCFDHLTNQTGTPYRRAHGRGWQDWASALGIVPSCCAESDVLKQLHARRLKVVAICKGCGFEVRRLRKLARNRVYVHPECGGRLRLL